MRVIYVSPSYFPRIGGVEYVVKSVAERLASRGHEVVVVAGSPEAEAPGREEMNGVEVLKWPTWAPGGAYHVPKASGKFAEAVAELCRGADVLHIHNIHAVTAYYAWRGWRRCGDKAMLVVTPHYHGSGHTAFRSALWAPWRRLIGQLLRNSVAHAVSSYEAGLLRRDFGVEPVVVEHGVDEDVLRHIWNPQDYAIYAGRLEKYKGLDLAAEVVKRLNRYQSLRFLAVGDGPYREALKRRLERLAVPHEILPFQPREKYLQLLSCARLFLMLSRREAFGLAVLEALAIGVPAVVAKPWGKVFEGKPRVLVVDADAPSQLIAESAMRLLAEAGQQRASRFRTWQEVVEDYLKLYRGKIIL